MKNDVKTYYFVDDATGEQFFVEETSLNKAKKVAKKYFTEPRFIEKVSDAEAEIMGYDTY